FEGGIAPDILISNMHHTAGLYEKYKDQITAIPLAYDLMAGNEAAVLANLYTQLGLPFHGLEFDEETMQPYGGENPKGKFFAGESAHPAEAEAILTPTVGRKQFKVYGGLMTPNQLPQELQE